MSENAIARGIIDLIVKHIDLQDSDRGVAKKAKISHTLIENFRSGASMKLDTMEKILAAYPELRTPIARIILGENEEKHTAATKSDEAAVKQELKKLRDEIQFLKNLTTMQAQTILKLSGGEVIEQG